MIFSLLNTLDKIMGPARENNPNSNMVETINSYVTELSKKKDQKRIPNLRIEDVIFSILYLEMGSVPPFDEEAVRGLIQFEIAKIEPEGDKNFDQTVDELAEVLEQTFKDIRPLYNTLINLDIVNETKVVGIEDLPVPVPVPAPANQGIHQIDGENYLVGIAALLLAISAAYLAVFIQNRFFNA